MDEKKDIQAPSRPGAAFEQLIDIMAKLRAPDGCPWDRKQTHGSLRRYLVEETAEVLEALDKSDMPHLTEEMGDLLLQIVFHSRIAEENGDFSILDVLDGINAKMMRRHPHVFTQDDTGAPTSTPQSWEELKAAEKRGKPVSKHPLGELPPDIPALLRAQKTGDRAVRLTFDWPDIAAVMAKVREELTELEQALAQPSPNQANIEEELGDLLFSLVNVARHTSLDAEKALSKGVLKFRERFARMVDHLMSTGRSLDSMSFEEKEEAWQAIKKR